MSSKKRKKKKTLSLSQKILSQLKKKHRDISFVLTLLALFSLFSFIGTFAWFTSADNVSNKFDGGKLIAEIDETFIPNEKWEPGEETEKQVRIANTGDIPTFVRVSLYEFILNFEVDLEDQTGNANLKTVDQAKRPEVDVDNTDTWKPAADGKGTFKHNNQYYVANQAWVSDPKNKKDMYLFDQLRVDPPKKYITLGFSTKIRFNVDPNPTSDYWLYSNGYFYYSRPLKPGEKSDDLLKNMTLSDSIPNKYKGSLYKLKIYMDAHDVTAPVTSAWELQPGEEAYKLLENQLK